MDDTGCGGVKESSSVMARKKCQVNDGLYPHAAVFWAGHPSWNAFDTAWPNCLDHCSSSSMAGFVESAVKNVVSKNDRLIV